MLMLVNSGRESHLVVWAALFVNQCNTPVDKLKITQARLDTGHHFRCIDEFLRHQACCPAVFAGLPCYTWCVHWKQFVNNDSMERVWQRLMWGTNVTLNAHICSHALVSLTSRDLNANLDA
jgi:hypothetical protein